MPRFITLDPSEVTIGRGRAAAAARQPYRDAIESMDAGRIELERGEIPARVKRLLRAAAREAGIRVRSTWEDDTQRSLIWKRTTEQPRASDTRRRG